MSESIRTVLQTVDEQHATRPAATRRQLVAGASAALGTMGLLGWAERAEAQLPTSDSYQAPNDPQTVANVAATAEVLATVINTVGPERVGTQLDATTRRNLAASAREELIHQNVLVSSRFGGVPAATRIWVPDRLFASAQTLLTGIAVGDTILVNMYLLACTVFARAGGLRGARFARFAAELAGVEAAHRALALQSLRGFGNDRAFLKFGQREEAPGLPNRLGF